MNIFGAFTFGSLIKTFLPGTIWLIAICLLEADVARLFGTEPVLIAGFRTKDASWLAVGFTAAVLLGLMSNILVFMGINDALVRNPVKRSHASLFAIYENVAKRIQERYRELLIIQNDHRQAFTDHTDVELVMLTELDLPKLAYVREQYWYHLEFQMNLLLSLAPLTVGLAARAWLKAGPQDPWELHVLLYALLFALAAVLLIKAARKNYARHIAKMLSLMVGFLAGKIEAERAAARK